MFLRSVCVERSMTMCELSEAIGFSKNVLSAYCSRNAIGVDAARRIADFLSCDISDIPGTKYYKGRFSKNELNNVNKSLTHSGFLRLKCPCCDNYVIISALCVGEMSDLE